MTHLRLAVLALLVGATSVWSATDGPAGSHTSQTLTSGKTRPALLELYTSEGCSSCPPAETWLNKLTADPRLWRDVVPVSFHVDYWDRLGWRDRFATASATNRQRAYAAAWGTDSVYTPGFVLDGREWQDWSSFSPGELPPDPTQPHDAGKLEAVITDGRTITVTYLPGDRSGRAADVNVVLLGFGLNTTVKAGENSGRSLVHDFVVLASETRTLPSPAGVNTATFTLSKPPAEAGRLAVAVWVQKQQNGRVFQAVGGWVAASR